MSIQNELISTIARDFVQLLEGHVFHRIVDEMHRTNLALPNATGKDKKAKVLADLKIIFDDLVVPLSEDVLSALIEIGIVALKAQL